MAIKKITVSNFRSFDSLNVDLSRLNILIGANASGKSNFIQIFKFLKDLAGYGLDHAISMQGGAEYLLNRRLGSSRDLCIEVVSDQILQVNRPSWEKRAKRILSYEVTETSYRFALVFSAQLKRFQIVNDVLKQKCKFYSHTKGEGKSYVDECLGEGEITVDSQKRAPKVSMRLPSGLSEKELLDNIFELNVWLEIVKRTRFKPRQLYLESSSFPAFVDPYEIGSPLRKTMENISIYDFDPRLSKKAQPLTGLAALESDGSNLAIVVRNLLKVKSKRQQFYNLISDVMPFVQEFGVQNIADTILLTLRENYAKGKSFPAFLLSDGTINLTALIISLFFEDRSVKIIEEPERNIHPYLISKVVNLMREASLSTQIITTTHNPEVVRHANVNDILVVSRSREGFSEVQRPADKQRIQAFLEDEMGLDDLYVQNLL